MARVVVLKVFVFICLLLINGCNVTRHGSFITSTYQNKFQAETVVKLGAVVGESCQTQCLYDGEVSTLAAIEQAKQQITGTVLLADMVINDTLAIEFGYSEQCISVHTIAMRNGSAVD